MARKGQVLRGRMKHCEDGRSVVRRGEVLRGRVNCGEEIKYGDER